MKTLVIYDSLYGNTRKIAEGVADACKAYGSVRFEQAEMLDQIDLQGEEMVFVGGPTHNQTLSPKLKKLLNHTNMATFYGVKAAVFDTRYEMPKWLLTLRSGTAANKLASKLSGQGAKVLVQPESFLIEHDREGPLLEGELERAKNWAKFVLEKAQEAATVYQ